MNVTIGGQEPEALIDIQNNSQTDDLGSSTIVVGDTQFNRTEFNSGDKVLIERTGGDTWTGYLTGDPTSESDGTIQIEAMDSRYELKNSNVSRPFFNVDDSTIIDEVVTTKVEERGSQDIHRGSSLANWESDFDVFELGNLATKKLHDKGSDIIFGGIREGGSGTYAIRYTDVDPSAVPGRAQIYKLVTRFIANDVGDQMTVDIELVTNNGLSIMWTVEPQGGSFQEYELSLEDAEPGQLTEPNTLEYRFNISGNITDNTGVGIDFATTYTFTLNDRDTSLSTSGVRETGRKISRRFDESALEVVQNLEVEQNYQSWIDEDEVLHFAPAGGQESDLQIIRGETAVTEAEFDRDYDNIINEVKVQGDGVQENVRDAESVRYYGVSSRDEPLVDESIKTREEARDRGNGYLQKHAWDEVVATFTIADTNYQSVSKGSSIFVDWSDLQGYFVVGEKSVNQAGYVTLELGVRT